MFVLPLCSSMSAEDFPSFVSDQLALVHLLNQGHSSLVSQFGVVVNLKSKSHGGSKLLPGNTQSLDMVIYPCPNLHLLTVL